jgi:hypothetical protein
MLSSLEAVNWDHSGIAPALEIAEIRWLMMVLNDG